MVDLAAHARVLRYYGDRPTSLSLYTLSPKLPAMAVCIFGIETRCPPTGCRMPVGASAPPKPPRVALREECCWPSMATRAWCALCRVDDRSPRDRPPPPPVLLARSRSASCIEPRSARAMAWVVEGSRDVEAEAPAL